MPKLIALRKSSKRMRQEVSDSSTEDKRAIRLKEAPTSQRVAKLEKLGLQQFSSVEKIPADEAGFQRLGFLGGYVVSSEDTDKYNRAVELLTDDYEVMPNVQLALPKPVLSNNRLSTRKAGQFGWPTETGIGEAHERGITGGGVLVGVLDTGCDADHVELAGKRIDFRYIAHDRNLNPIRTVRAFDTDGYGTHVCGIIAGQGVGIAPDVDLMVAAVIESETLKTNLERIAIGLNWMLSQIAQPDNLNKPAVINISLGFKHNWLQGEDLSKAMRGIKRIIETLVKDFDVLPIVAVGNDGPGVIRVPASLDEALSVGAVSFDSQPWEQSGGGNSPETGSIKPDVVGYGVDILSSIERDIDNNSWYARMSGTSMAAPYVTGIAALLASSNNQLQGQVLRSKILRTANNLRDLPQPRVGVGLARFMDS